MYGKIRSLRVEVVFAAQLHHQLVRHCAKNSLRGVDVTDTDRSGSLAHIIVLHVQACDVECLALDEIFLGLQVQHVGAAQVQVDVVRNEHLHPHHVVAGHEVQAPLVHQQVRQVAADIRVAVRSRLQRILVAADAHCRTVFIGKHVVQAGHVVEELARAHVQLELDLARLRCKHTFTTLLRLCHGRHNQKDRHDKYA